MKAKRPTEAMLVLLRLVAGGNRRWDNDAFAYHGVRVATLTGARERGLIVHVATGVELTSSWYDLTPAGHAALGAP